MGFNNFQKKFHSSPDLESEFNGKFLIQNILKELKRVKKKLERRE